MTEKELFLKRLEEKIAQKREYNASYQKRKRESVKPNQDKDKAKEAVRRFREKTERIDLSVNPKTKEKFVSIAKEKNLSLTETFEFLISTYHS